MTLCFAPALPSRQVQSLSNSRQNICPARASWTASAPSVDTGDAAAVPTGPATPIAWRGAENISAAARMPGEVMNIGDLMKVLPHRFPFLLVDRVVEYEAGKRCVAIKNVTVNEPFFPGHFPDRPIMPGVLQIEALAQTGGLLLKDIISGDEKRDFFFGGVDNVRWRKPVLPGDSLVMEVVMKSYKPRFGIAKMVGKAYVDGKVACEAELTLVIDVQGKAKQ